MAEATLASPERPGPDPSLPEDRAAMRRMAEDPEVQGLAHDLVSRSLAYRYSYNFTWLGRPIIQYPEDLLALQEIVWAQAPDLILETGIAHGGSLIFYASLLAMLGGDRRVVGVDIDIRAHNREAIEAHPLSRWIDLVEGSAVDDVIVRRVFDLAKHRRNALVVLDSMHTHDHVLAELRAYAPLVGKGGHLVVLDTIIERLPKTFFQDRPWGPGNNPMTAVTTFLAENDRFVIDERVENRLLLSMAPRGFLRCLRDP
jgi:cephalosporin hydroxylase